MGLRDTWTSVIAISLFTFALFMFAYVFLTANNPSSAVITDSSFNNTFSRINESISDMYSEVQTQESSFNNESGVVPSSGNTFSTFLILKSAFTIPKALLSTIPSMFVSLLNFISSQLFDGITIVNMTIITLFVGMVLFLIIKFIRTGESER